MIYMPCRPRYHVDFITKKLWDVCCPPRRVLKSVREGPVCVVSSHVPTSGHGDAKGFVIPAQKN